MLEGAAAPVVAAGALGVGLAVIWVASIPKQPIKVSAADAQVSSDIVGIATPGESMTSAVRAFGRVGAEPNAPRPPDEKCKDEAVSSQLPLDQLLAPPPSRGLAPIGLDGQPVELHHDGQKDSSKLKELSQQDHRGGDNFKKNHSNTGSQESDVDRKNFKKQKKAYWRKQWDCGRFDKMNPEEARKNQALEEVKRARRERLY